MHSQRMASIAPIVIGCIDYLAYGTIFTRAMFRPKKKLVVLFPARKATYERREVVSKVLINRIGCFETITCFRVVNACGEELQLRDHGANRAHP
jgi:hypothetical protein